MFSTPLQQVSMEREAADLWELSFIVPSDHGMQLIWNLNVIL